MAEARYVGVDLYFFFRAIFFFPPNVNRKSKKSAKKSRTLAKIEKKKKPPLPDHCHFQPPLTTFVGWGLQHYCRPRVPRGAGQGEAVLVFSTRLQRQRRGLARFCCVTGHACPTAAFRSPPQPGSVTAMGQRVKTRERRVRRVRVDDANYIQSSTQSAYSGGYVNAPRWRILSL